jgi:hypothetical protein
LCGGGRRSMADAGIGDYFISDVDSGTDEDDDLLTAPIVVPVAAPPQPVALEPAASVEPAAVVRPVEQAPVAARASVPAVQPARPQAAVRPASRAESACKRSTS